MIEKIENKIFALREDALESLLDRVSKANFSERKPKKTNVEVENEISKISVRGPLFRESSLLTEILGSSSYEQISRELDSALLSKSKAIILDVDSPGGEVSGCSELSTKIRELRGKKPIIAYASGDMCSAAYWIASACDEVVVSRTSLVGSVGVVAMLDVGGDGEHEKRTRKIVSTQTPHKNVGAETEEGREKIQKKVDDLAKVFLEDLQENRKGNTRSVEDETVRHNGSIFVGENSVKAGLADRVATMEKLRGEIMGKEMEIVPEEKTKDLAAEERERILGILSLKGDRDISEEFIRGGFSMGDAAIAIRKKELASEQKKEKYLSAISSTEKELEGLATSTEERQASVSDILKLAAKYGV